MSELSMETIITVIGLAVAGLAAVLGIWVERDEKKPPRYAYALSILILMATGVGMYQTYADALAGQKLEADMARMLATIERIASDSGDENPELQEFMKTELTAQSRANPKVVAKMAQRVADEGGDPTAMLQRHLPASEVEGLSRQGSLKIKPVTMVQAAPGGSSERRGMMRIKPKAEPTAEPAVAASAPVEDDAGAPEPKPDLIKVGGGGLVGGKALGLGGAKEGGGGLLGGAKPGAAKPDAAKPAPAKPDAAKPATTAKPGLAGKKL
jgi:hypothetical protein